MEDKVYFSSTGRLKWAIQFFMRRRYAVVDGHLARKVWSAKIVFAVCSFFLASVRPTVRRQLQYYQRHATLNNYNSFERAIFSEVTNVKKQLMEIN